MSISVIIPFYNETIFLSQTVHSALGLGERLHQIIIVDDSSGRYPDLLDRMASLDNRIEIVTNAQNAGASASRNAGLARVTGKQVLFLDSDDVISSHAILEASDLIQRDRAELVHIPTMVMAQKTSALFRFPRDDRLFAKPAKGLSPDSFPEIRYAIANWSFLFDAQYLADHAIRFDPEQRMFEDHLFILGAVEKARNFALLGQWGHLWRKRGGSLTTTNYNREDMDSQLASIRKSLHFLSERHGPTSAAVQRDVAFALSRYLMTWPTLYTALGEREAESSQTILSELAHTFAPYMLTQEVCSDAVTQRVFGHSLQLISGPQLAPSQLPSILDMLAQEQWDALSAKLNVKPASKPHETPQPKPLKTFQDALDRFHASASLTTSGDLRLFSEVVFDEIDEWAPPPSGGQQTDLSNLAERFAKDQFAILRKRSVKGDKPVSSFSKDYGAAMINTFSEAFDLTSRYTNGERTGPDADNLSKPAIAAMWRAVENGLSPRDGIQVEQALATLANRAVTGDADISGRRKIRTRTRLALRSLMPRLKG